MDMTEFLIDLAYILEVDDGGLSDGFELDEDIWDSLAIVSVISLIDEHFGFTVDGKALKGCQTIGDLLELINSKMGA